MSNTNFFLDSGAFSAWNRGVEIDIDDYINYIIENKEYIDVYANLDVIGDAEKTYKNQKYMESKGLTPLPVYHTNKESLEWLEKYIKEGYTYVAMGGVAGKDISVSQIQGLFDVIFSRYICDRNGYAKIKVHGFGITSFDLLFRYPWFSVDSTTWVMCAQFGQIIVPRFENKKFVYDKKPVKLDISEQSPRRKKEGMHFDNISEKERNIVLSYLEQKGITLEQVQSDYFSRWKINIIYYLDLERNLIPYNEKKFIKKERGFFV